MRNPFFHKALLASSLVLSFSMTTPIFAKGKMEIKQGQTSSDEEAFLIRRIAAFWKDGDYAIVKTQITDFLNKHPKSHMKDYFLGILGDIHLQENQYQEALVAYEKMGEGELLDKVILNKLHCYYELDQFESIIREGSLLASQNLSAVSGREEELYFLLAESYYRAARSTEELGLKQDCAAKAKGFYQKLKNPDYQKVSEFAIAEIYAILEDYSLAANAFHALAVSHPNMKEDLLFQAATLEAKFNTETASETFIAVGNMKGPRAKEAEYNLVVLSFQREDYESVIKSSSDLSPHIPDSQKTTLQFILGKSHFATGNFSVASKFLSDYIASDSTPSEQLKNALLIQMTCAHKNSDEALFSRTFDHLKSLFPSDPELPKALFMHAMMLKDQGEIKRADEKLEEIKVAYKDFQHQESFIFEHGLLAHQNERWGESYKTFKTFIREFTESSNRDLAWRLFLSSSLHLFQEQNEQNNTYSKVAFFNDLQEVLDKARCLSDEEQKDYSLIYAKTAYELGNYTKAVSKLQDMIFSKSGVLEKSDPNALAEAHFISGLCHAELGGDTSAFCMHLEQAMVLNPELYDSATTHLQLYNAYISLAGMPLASKVEFDSSEKAVMVAQAAEHLYDALKKEETVIKTENLLWLANHYFEQSKHMIKTSQKSEEKASLELSRGIERAGELFHLILFKGNQLVKLNADNASLEYEILKCAELAGFHKKWDKKLSILTGLIDQQNEHPDFDWKTQKEVLFELAKTYDQTGESQKALETYSFIAASGKQFPSAMGYQASLRSASLQFKLLNEGARQAGSEPVTEVLNDLKELQIRKNPMTEPVHLEAALEYAQIRAILSPPESRESRYLFFLGRMAEDFSSQEDLVTQDYLIGLKRDPAKMAIYDAYMKFIEAEKLTIQAKILCKEERTNDMEEVEQQAMTLYNELKNEPSTPEALMERVASSIEAINALNAY